MGHSFRCRPGLKNRFGRTWPTAADMLTANIAVSRMGRSFIRLLPHPPDPNRPLNSSLSNSLPRNPSLRSGYPSPATSERWHYRRSGLRERSRCRGQEADQRQDERRVQPQGRRRAQRPQSASKPNRRGRASCAHGHRAELAVQLTSPSQAQRLLGQCLTASRICI